MRTVLLIILLSISTLINSTATQQKEIVLLPEISKENLYKKIVESGVLFPEIVFSQAILESGHFKSRLFLKNNNLFGMKIPRKRKTFAIGKGKSGYAKYSHWTKSVDDYIEWQKYLLKDKSISKESYLRKLSKIYCTNPGYVKRLRQIFKFYNKINKQNNESL
jgi:flagellum-specific peptidoglycan hydrolase FlgJ